MATFRVGVGSFNINDGSVGIGTEGSGHGNLKVEGTLKSTSADVLGVSTFTRYSGFNADNVSVSNRDLTLSGEYSTTGDIVVEDGASLTVGLGSTACVGAVECISVKNHFSVPVGDTVQRNETSGYSEGTVRYNIDLGTMEFFNGNEWRQFNYQADIQNSPSSRGVMVVSGGYPASDSPSMLTSESIQISSGGNAQFFGTLADGLHNTQGCSNSTRGLIMGGRTPSAVNDIMYFTVATTSDAIDFGDLTANASYAACVASNTRGVCMARSTPSDSNVIDYVEIGTLGNALDFGDAAVTARSNSGASSLTRGFQFGGTPVGADVVQGITIAAKGNSTEFGSLTRARRNTAAFANTVRAVVAAGSPDYATTIDYMTSASAGEMIDFGNLTVGRSQPAGACNFTRGLVSGGTDSGTNLLTSVETVEIASTGNAVSFGEMSLPRNASASSSDSHGGLGGY